MFPRWNFLQASRPSEAEDPEDTRSGNDGVVAKQRQIRTYRFSNRHPSSVPSVTLHLLPGLPVPRGWVFPSSRIRTNTSPRTRHSQRPEQTVGKLHVNQPLTHGTVPSQSCIDRLGIPHQPSSSVAVELYPRPRS